ncbi:MAG: nucleotidyltransferase domain-containing protein [Bacteroidales bacterium]|nr:nucleotidyltransferase domain-containing protein [Bacteroidales bacterium]
MSQKQVIEILKKYIHILYNEGIPVERAFLYGSYAKGEATPESDIDVMLVSKIFEKNNDKLIGKTWRLTTEVDSRIEPYIVGKKRFLTDEYSPLLEIVRQEGIEIDV